MATLCAPSAAANSSRSAHCDRRPEAFSRGPLQVTQHHEARDEQHREDGRHQRQAALDELAREVAEPPQQASQRKKRSAREIIDAPMNDSRSKCATPLAIVTSLYGIG